MEDSYIELNRQVLSTFVLQKGVEVINEHFARLKNVFRLNGREHALRVIPILEILATGHLNNVPCDRHASTIAQLYQNVNSYFGPSTSGGFALQII